MLRSLISVRCSWSLVGTASVPLGDDRAAGTAAGTAVPAGQAAVRESLGLNSERPIPMGKGAKRAPWRCPGRCRAQPTARRPATSQSGLALPVSGLCLAGMNPLRPIGCRGRDVGRRLGIWPPPGRRPGLLLTRRSVERTVPAGGRLGDLPCPRGWLLRKIRLNVWPRLLSARRPPCRPARGGVIIRTARSAGPAQGR